MSATTAVQGGKSLRDEEYREYELSNGKVYRINSPVELFTRPGGTTHRVLDAEGMVHCVPAVGVDGTILRWKPRPGTDPVAF